MRGLQKKLHPMAQQTNRQTDRQTDGHGDCQTHSAQLGRVDEKVVKCAKNMKKCVFCKLRIEKLKFGADSRTFCANMRSRVHAFQKLCLIQFTTKKQGQLDNIQLLILLCLHVLQQRGRFPWLEHSIKCLYKGPELVPSHSNNGWARTYTVFILLPLCQLWDIGVLIVLHQT